MRHVVRAVKRYHEFCVDLLLKGNLTEQEQAELAYAVEQEQMCFTEACVKHICFNLDITTRQ